jgi:hypothetical protein
MAQSKTSIDAAVIKAAIVLFRRFSFVSDQRKPSPKIHEYDQERMVFVQEIDDPWSI